MSLKASTIRCYLSAIAFYHKVKGYETETNSFVNKKLLRYYGKSDKNTAVRKPITQPLLGEIVREVKASTMSTYDRRLYAAVYMMMYHGAMRVSEVAQGANSTHAISLDQIRISTNTIGVSFDTYKHSDSKGIQPVFMIDAEMAGVCPVKTLKKYIKTRGKKPGPLFVYEDGHPITRGSIVKQLKDILNTLGLNSDTYNTHSLRIGKTTDLYKSGATHLQIMKCGRWKSNAYLTYVKPDIIKMNV